MDGIGEVSFTPEWGRNRINGFLESGPIGVSRGNDPGVCLFRCFLMKMEMHCSIPNLYISWRIKFLSLDVMYGFPTLLRSYWMV